MAGIPQVITEDRASGAQFIDGSLKFDSGKIQYLKRTFPSAGNQRTYTFSVWLKRASGFGAFRAILTTLSSDGTSNTGAWIGSGDGWYYFFGNSNFLAKSMLILSISLFFYTFSGCKTPKNKKQKAKV